MKSSLYDFAIDDYNNLLQADDKDPILRASYLLSRGEAFLEKGEYERALADFNAGLTASPTFYELYIARARLHLTTDQPDLAIADCTTALTLYPNAASAYLRRGLAYWLKKSYRLSEEDLSKAIKFGPEIMSYHYRADIYKRQGRFKEALADWRRILELRAEAPFEREMQQQAAVEITKDVQ